MVLFYSRMLFLHFYFGSATPALLHGHVSSRKQGTSRLGSRSTNGNAPRRRAPAAAESPSMAASLKLPALVLTKQERDFMERLHVLIRTPRAAETFVNIYKVFRGTLEQPLPGEPRLEEYLQKQLYPIPMLLLALQVCVFRST
jgi:hypothetical protein